VPERMWNGVPHLDTDSDEHPDEDTDARSSAVL
jgi:hypothetical protein